jgi:chromatin remodeling complex protein RSC6
LAQPAQPDEALAQVVGSEPQPRAELTKRLWDYIKQHNLQDAQDRRMINADERLERIFDGKRKVSMFELARLLNNHLVPT